MIIKQNARIAGVMIVLALSSLAADAEDCDAPLQGTGRVVDVIDGRTLRLDDGREVRLTGLAALGTPERKSLVRDLLKQLVLSREVTLHAANDAPDRYGRMVALARLDPDGPSVQVMLAGIGGALADGTMEKACMDDMQSAEADARRARLGLWSAGSTGPDAVIKNTESRGDILAGIGRFTIAEGRVRSVRQVGAVTYVNFGRRWTHDTVMTIPSKSLASFTAAGLAPQSFEGQRLRIRGIVEQRGGPESSPRFEATRPGQVEIVAGAAITGAK
jgi:endonuclease YncB( thermonuclease family)